MYGDDVPDEFREAEERRLRIAAIAQGGGPYRSVADRREAFALAELMVLNPQAPQRILSERDSVSDILRGYIHEEGGVEVKQKPAIPTPEAWRSKPWRKLNWKQKLIIAKERIAQRERAAAEAKNRKSRKKRKGRFS